MCGRLPVGKRFCDVDASWSGAAMGVDEHGPASFLAGHRASERELMSGLAIPFSMCH